MFCRGACLEYLPDTNTFVPGPSLLGSRWQSAHVRLANGSWWVMSGFDQEDRYTTEIYQEGRFVRVSSLSRNGYPA